jgi:hypothetical protein
MCGQGTFLANEMFLVYVWTETARYGKVYWRDESK